MDFEDIRQGWNRIAGPYQRRWSRRADVVQYGPFIPDESQLKLLGNVRGKRILDLGCGGGQACIALSMAGGECVGVDISDAQIDYARALASEYSVAAEFHCSEMCGFLGLQEDEVYDLAISILGVPYIEDQRALVREIHRVLMPGGRFLFVTNHPIYDITSTEDQRTVVRRSYFDLGREEWTWRDEPSGLSEPLVTYSRTIGETHRDLTDAGFIVDRILEPEAVAENMPVSDSDVDRFAMVPPNIIWTARAG